MIDLSGQYLGRYYLAERLGEGGMAVVYKAYDTRLERDVAVKIIRSAAFPPEELDQVLKRFEREAKALAKLSHHNIVKVYDFGEHEGSPYLVMEYLPGGTLKKFLGKPFPWQDAVRLVLPVARGVAYAHKRGILHRDIKPANVLIADDGEPMLSDFGIAKLFEGDQTTALTGSGMAIGTPEYMAPEQWTGMTSPLSDQYSLGIVLYEMVAGRKPYVADTPGAILIKQVTEPLPGPRMFVADLPEALEHVLIKALAREPGNRYPDVNAFISALENINVEVLVVTSSPEPKPVEATYEVPASKPAISDLSEVVTKVGSEPVHTLEASKPQKVEEPFHAEISPQDEKAADHTVDVVGSRKIAEPLPTKLSHPAVEEAVDTMDTTEPKEVKGLFPVKVTVEKTRQPTKFSWRGMWILIGGVIIVLMVWLGSSLIEKFFAPAQVVTEQTTATLTLTVPPVVETQILKPIRVGETPTLDISPTEAGSPTPVPLPTEITDEKGVEMVFVPEGKFVMGSNDVGSQPNQRPAHQVFLDSYYIDKYEVTNALYKACVEVSVCNQPANLTKYSSSEYAQHPVTWVYWDMATTYCEWRGARLPTEAEWEKAARGTDGRIFPWGNDYLDENKANYCDSSCPNVWAGLSRNDGYPYSSPVGNYPDGVSPYGAYDMAGNVEEWVSDWYGENYYNVSPASNPTGPESGAYHLLRGGFWGDGAGNLEVTSREFYLPQFPENYYFGFRCVKDASP